MSKQRRMRFLLSASVMALSAVVVINAQQRTAPAWDSRAAAASLDNRMLWWTTWPSAARDHGTFCVSCHTALPYAIARSSLRGALHENSPSEPELKLFDNVVKRVRMWRDIEPFYPDQRSGLPKTSESRGAESILNAVILATHDAASGAPSDDLRTAFGNMWALQMRTGELSGAWAWLNFRYEPWEAPRSPYFGAALAALAVGTAPGGYASSPDAQENIRLLKNYLAKEYEHQDLFNRIMLLWASTKLPGVATPEQRDQIVTAALGKQNPDGGWGIATLGQWQRVDGTPLDLASDGYATGLVTFVLEQAAPAQHAPIVRGLEWLSANQDKHTGGWSAVSLNKKRDPASDAGKFMSDAASAYAVMALTAR